MLSLDYLRCLYAALTLSAICTLSVTFSLSIISIFSFFYFSHFYLHFTFPDIFGLSSFSLIFFPSWISNISIHASICSLFSIFLFVFHHFPLLHSLWSLFLPDLSTIPGLDFSLLLNWLPHLVLQSSLFILSSLISFLVFLATTTSLPPFGFLIFFSFLLFY